MKGVFDIVFTAPAVIIGEPLLIKFSAQQPVIVTDFFIAVIKKFFEFSGNVVTEAFLKLIGKIPAPRIVGFTIEDFLC